MRCIRFFQPALIIFGCAILSPTALAARFIDLDGVWSEKYVNMLSDQGVIGSEEDGKFQPDQPVTRATLAFWLVKTLGLYGQPVSPKPSFKDVKPTDWCYKPIEIIRQNNYISGYADGFRPNQLIQKAEVLSILARTLNTPAPTNDQITQALARYKDKAKIPFWARSAVAQCALANIIISSTPDVIDSTKITTRGETAALLFRVNQFLTHQTIDDSAAQADSTQPTAPQSALSQPQQQLQQAQQIAPPAVNYPPMQTGYANQQMPYGGGGMPVNYGAPPNNYGAPPTAYNAAPTGYGAPLNNYGGVPNNYAAPPTSYVAPPNNYGAPPTNYGAPPINYSPAPVAYGPPMGYGAAQVAYAPVQAGYAPLPQATYSPPGQPVYPTMSQAPGYPSMPQAGYAAIPPTNPIAPQSGGATNANTKTNAAATTPKPAAVKPPPMVPVVLKKGTEFLVTIKTAVDSGSAQIGQTIEGVMTHPLLSGSTEMIPANSKLSGKVVNLLSAKTVNYTIPGRIDFRIFSVATPDGRKFPINATGVIASTASSGNNSGITYGAHNAGEIKLLSGTNLMVKLADDLLMQTQQR